MNSVLDNTRLEDLKDFIEYDKHISSELFNKAIETLKKVKKTRNELESIYISNMDFEVTNIARENILSKILKYLE